MLNKGCLGILHTAGGLIFRMKYFILFPKEVMTILYLSFRASQVYNI